MKVVVNFFPGGIKLIVSKTPNLLTNCYGLNITYTIIYMYTKRMTITVRIETAHPTQAMSHYCPPLYISW